MARSTPLAVRFTTDGFDDLRKQLKSAGESFESAMNKAMEASKEAIAAGKVAAEGTKEWKDAQADLVRAAKAANNAVAGAFRELNVRTTASIDAQKKAAISAFEAIKKSGVASAQDIANAQASLNKKLKDLEAQKDQTNKNDPEKQRLAALEEAYKSLGVASRASLEAQKEAAKEAFDAIKNSGTATFEELSEARKNYHARITAIDARINQYSPEEVRKRKALEAQQAIVDSYQRLGVQSIESLQRQRQEAIAAYKKIKNSGTASYKDIIAAQKAMDAQLEALDRQIDEHAQGWDKVKVMGKNALDAIKTKLTTLDVGVKNSTEGFTVLKGVLANLISGGIQAGLSAIAGLFQNITSGITGFVQESLGAFMEVGGAMNQFRAVSGATEEEIKAINKQVEKLGIETSKTPAQIAQAAVELSKAGFSSKQVEDSLAGIVQAAEASGESLSTASSVIGATLNQFGLEASEAGRVADVLAAASNASAASIGGLGDGLKYIGAIGGSANQRLEDMVVSLSLLRDAGLDDSQTGTNLRSAFVAIMKATAGVGDEAEEASGALKKKREMLEELGVQFRQTDGQMRPFIELLPELAEKMNALSPERRESIALTLFGTEGANAIIPLIGQVDTKLQGLVETVFSAKGAAAETSAELMKGLGPAIEQLDASLVVIKGKLGEALEPAADKLVRLTISWVNELNNVPGIMDGIAAISKRITDFFEQNPEIIKTINAEMTALVEDALQAASDLAGEMLDYLTQNPTAITDAIKMFTQLVSGVMGTVVNLAGELLSSLQKNPSIIQDTIKSTEGLLRVIGKLVEGAIAFGKAISDANEGWEFMLNPVNKVKRQAAEVYGDRAAQLIQAEYDRLEREELDKYFFHMNSPLGTLKGKAAQKIAEQAYINIVGNPKAYGLTPVAAGTGGTGTGGTGTIGTLSKPGTVQTRFTDKDFAGTPGFVFAVPGGELTGVQKGKHHGVDIFAPVGTPVLASMSGTIVQAQKGGTRNKEDSNPNKPGYQDQHSVKIKLDNPFDFNGKTIRYIWNTHLTEIAEGIVVGAKVVAGQKLGEVGMAGEASHLHQAFGEIENFADPNPLTNQESVELLTAIKNQPIQTATTSTKTATSTSATAPSTQSVSETERQAIADLLKRYNSPMTPDDFYAVSKETGVQLDALLTQSMIESGFGTTGRGARFKNPLNWGNDDAGNNRGFASFREGLMAGAKGLKENFNFTSPEQFMANNFMGKYGIYATDPKYRQKYQAALNQVRAMGITGQAQVATAVTGTTSADAKAKKEQKESEKEAEKKREAALKRREQSQKLADDEAIANLKHSHEMQQAEMRRNQASEYDIKQQSVEQALELRKLETKQAIAQLKREKGEIEKKQAEKLKAMKAGEELTSEQRVANYAADMQLIDKQIQIQENSLKRTTEKITQDFTAIAEDRAKTEAQRQIDQYVAMGQEQIQLESKALELAAARQDLSQSELTYRRAVLEAARQQLEIDRLNRQFLEGLVKPEDLENHQRRIEYLKTEAKFNKEIAEINYARDQAEEENRKAALIVQAEYEQLSRLIVLAEKDGNLERVKTLKLLQAQYEFEQKIAAIKQQKLPQNLESQAIAAETQLYQRQTDEILRGNIDLGQSFRDLLSGPLTEFFQTAIDGSKSLGDAFSAMAKSILGSLAQIGAELATSSLLNMLGLGNRQQPSSGIGGWIANLFGFGGSALAAASPAGAVGGMPFPFMGKKFAEGGFTGKGGKWQPMGIVHGGEYVLNKEATAAIGLPNLNFMNRFNQLPEFALGGYVGNMENRLLSGFNAIQSPQISLPPNSNTPERRSAATTTNTVTVNINDKESRFYRQSRTLAREMASELRNV